MSMSKTNKTFLFTIDKLRGCIFFSASGYSDPERWISEPHDHYPVNQATQHTVTFEKMHIWECGSVPPPTVHIDKMPLSPVNNVRFSQIKFCMYFFYTMKRVLLYYIAKLYTLPSLYLC